MKSFKKIEKLVKKVYELNKKDMPYVRKDIDLILRNNVKDIRHIEKTLDRLLDKLYLGLGEQEFKKLNNYYKTIHKQNSLEYEKFYREIINEE